MSSFRLSANALKAWLISATWGLLEVLIDVFWFWWFKIASHLRRSDDTAVLKRKLQMAQSYEEWEKYAYKLDSMLGNDLW